MLDVSAQDLQKRIGDVQAAALKAPVLVTAHGKPRCVLMSVEEFARLKTAAGESVSAKARPRGFDTRVILPDVLERLRAVEPELRRHHVEHLWLFGSVARGDDGADSDVDLIVEIDPKADVSLTAISRLRLDLCDLLGRNVDVVEWRTLRADVARAADTDAVRIF